MGVLERTVHPKVPGANPDWTIPQGFELYSEAEHRTWTTLYERQAEILPGRACEAFLYGLTRWICMARASPISSD